MGARSMAKSLARDFCASFAQKQTVARSGPFMRALEAGGQKDLRHEGNDELPLPSVRRAVHQSRGSALSDFWLSSRYICRDPFRRLKAHQVSRRAYWYRLYCSGSLLINRRFKRTGRTGSV
jgi:hypothetical protein